MIKKIVHKGLRQFYESGQTAGIRAEHAPRLGRQLAKLDAARNPADLNIPGWGLHPLKGDRKGHWAISVSGNWRVTFTFEGEDVTLVDYTDYH